MDGRRIKKDFTSGNGADVEFLYDLAGRPVVELLSSNGTYNRGEVFLGGAHVATYVNNNTYFVYTDWMGTERLRRDAAGSTAQTCAWSDYGGAPVCTVNTDPAGISPHGYAGYEYDKESGLHHMWFRDYNPRLGRFLQVDPLAGNIGDPQSLNRYAYVTNDPANWTDPLGLNEQICVWRETWDGVTLTHTLLFCVGGGGTGVTIREIIQPVDPIGDRGGGITRAEAAKQVHQCAARTANSISLARAVEAAAGSRISGNDAAAFLNNAISGNDISTVSDLISGQGRIAAAKSFVTSNPIPNASAVSLTARAVAAIPTGPAPTVLRAVGFEGITNWGEQAVRYGSFAGSRPTVATSVAGKLIGASFNFLSGVKLAYDGIAYTGALAFCGGF